jgi:hypothetical protein
LQHSRALHVTFTCLLLTACASEDEGGAEFLVQDSAGVSIFELTVDPWLDGTAWHLSASPLTQIGVQAGDSAHELYGVNRAHRLSDGSIAVSSSTTNDIRIFDARGGLARRIGRSGEGPGEFNGLGGFEVLPDDTLLAVDLGRHALTAFAADGSFSWTRSFATGSCSWIAEEWPVRFRLPDGRVLIVCEASDLRSRMQSGQAPIGSTDRSTALVLAFPATDASANTIHSLPGIEYGIIDAGQGPGTMYPPFGRRVVYALTGNGLFIGNQERFAVREYSSNGNLQSIVRGPTTDLAITPADLDDLRRALMLNTPTDDPAATQFIEQYLSTYPRPQNRPAYGRILVDAAGRLWISEYYHQFETPVRWAILDFDERNAASLTVPERFEIYDVGVDYVLGRWRDEIGVEYVQLYALQQASS